MTATETVDLFSFDRRAGTGWWTGRRRAGGEGGRRDVRIASHVRDPGRRAATAADGAADRIFEMRVAEPGRIVMELDPHESLENTIGLLHGATAAALLDTAMGCAIADHAAGGAGRSVTLDLKLTYLRPLSVRSGTISAEGKVVKLGRQTSYAEGFVRDGAGNLAVHATATFTMIGVEKAK